MPQDGRVNVRHSGFGFHSFPLCGIIHHSSFLRSALPRIVSRPRSFLQYWLPVLLWMGAIFSASGDTKSFERSSRIIAPLVRFFFPRLQDATVDQIVFLVRKCAHLTEYGVMAVLFWRALRKPARGPPRPWVWTEARMAILLVALYATSDEFHQLFVPSRQALVTDVMIDMTGGIAGLLLLWGAGRALKKW